MGGLFKIFTKILANRLQKYLPKLIHPTQNNLVWNWVYDKSVYGPKSRGEIEFGYESNQQKDIAKWQELPFQTIRWKGLNLVMDDEKEMNLIQLQKPFVGKKW